MTSAQLVVLLTQLLTAGPQLIAAIRATFSADDEAELQSQLAALRAQNESQYDSVMAALNARAGR